ncbi:DUF4055 domain-containing protein [Leptolyngbya sp. FACHB-16]|uniref:DUF4055 domain-containing protein n=1 Tax=unclassified Leptolyngbya TaxID=2650499 RepID=UPI001681FA45|nr:DUF4055 domain-containing protein [Leptolyngbya sp. FACHB-16]MBD2156222.1 DUF4055 domain-containing protein [Leptolyngbya sp. FACHB-16]
MAYNYSDRFKATAVRDGKPNIAAGDPQQKRSPVFLPGDLHEEMCPYWDAIEAVRGGTQKLLEMGEAYLPKEPMEDDEAYSRRLNRAVLGFTPWYVRLVAGMTGTVFRKPVVMPEQVPVEVEPQFKDLTLKGDGIDAVSAEWFESGVDYNYAGMLIDYPDTEGLQTRRDERDRQVRPYWILYPGSKILDIEYSQQGSVRKVSFVRLHQVVKESVEGSEFEKELIEQVLVYDLMATPDGTRCRYRIFRQDDDGEFVHKQGITSLDEVPFVVFAVDKKNDMAIAPPMTQIANLNLKHYQLSGDIDHALHIGAVPRLFIFGMSANELGDLGSTSEAVCIPNPDAKVEWVVAPITSYDALQSRIEKCELQMASLALAAMHAQKNVGESADAKKLDRAQSDSILSQMAIAFQTALNQALAIHCKYIGLEPVEVEIPRDFDATQITSDMVRALADVVNTGRLTTETFLRILHRGELGFPDGWTVEDEVKRLEAENKQEAAPKQLPDPFGEEDIPDEADPESEPEPDPESVDQ